MDFQKDLIQLDQSFQTKEEAIRFCGNLLADGGYVENDYVEAMIQRNKELSVYMGNFIAIPHGTDEAKEKVLKSGITVVQVPDGVNFGSDENPQIALFCLALQVSAMSIWKSFRKFQFSVRMSIML